MNEDIQFLKDLQNELKYQESQDYDSQAAPRFWTVGDYKMVGCPDGCHDEYYISASNVDYYGSLDDLLEDIKEDSFEDYPDCAENEFKEIDCEPSAIDWIKEYYDESAEMIPVREEHFIHPNTMFLTKAEAKRHIELNHYHYTDRAHTYAMTAWRAPKVEKLLKILETFDWSLVEKQTPKKIFRHPWNGINNVPYDLCPSCETNLCTEAGMFANKKMNYCEKCGQKLDWE